MKSLSRFVVVLKALILRDIKSRFLGSAWGYIISLGWPLSHIGILLVVHGLTGRLQPYGDSAALWYSTGIVPFMAFSYTMRFIVLGLMQNAPLLSFPVVNILDIVAARVIVEILSVFIVFSVITFSLAFFGVSFIPLHPIYAFYAICLGVSLGISVGIIFAVAAKISPVWNIISVFLSMSLWFLSGIFFVPFNLPSVFVALFFLNPMAHVVSIYRSAYYDGYAVEYTDPYYVLTWCILTGFLALILERTLRGRILQG